MPVKDSNHNLSAGFQRSARKFAERPALDVGNGVYTYAQLAGMASGLAQKIRSDAKPAEKLAALLAYRSPAAFAGVLAILACGRGYVPLHPEFPAERNLRVLELAGTGIMIVSAECQSAFDELIKRIDGAMTFILVELEQADRYAQAYPRHRFIVLEDLTGKAAALEVEPVAKDDIAYLLFTSGSTGEPKGVPVSHHNARSYVEFVTGRYEIDENDRVSQMHDMTFDNSIHDIYVAWEIGACLCVPAKQDKLLPVSFIQKKKITLWFSVPSVAGIIDQYGRLEPGIFPSLRYSFFAGEALYAGIAQKWQKAAPNGKLVNTYGPTETTVTITYYDWDGVLSPPQCLNGIVPLGRIYDGNKGRVLREDGRQAAPGEPGELCLSGSQVTKEYWNNPAQTKAHYVKFADTGDVIWYKSGDLVREGEDGCLYYLGRIDNQVKIQGNRVELGAIDQVLREATGVELAVSVPVLVSAGNASAVVAFVCGVQSRDENAVLEYCRGKLPKYMVPSKVRFVDDMPFNRNGKIDRLQLQRLLEKS